MAKKCLHIHVSGGIHTNNPMNHADPFLRDAMKFMGVGDYRSFIIEGHNAAPDQAESNINEGHDLTPSFVDWFSQEKM